jgi:exopolyphosphatase/guanosine-5'-triphosphate,3'-diphosphate pyrophosphatase
MIAIFEFFKIESLQVAKGALRHGLLYDMVTQEDAMLDLRNASVNRLARKFATDEAHAENVADVADKLFEKIAENIHFAPGERQSLARKLRWASLLHEIGSIVSPIDAHLHGAYILDHADPAGFSQNELHCLSLLIQGHKAKLKKLEADFDDQMFVLPLLCLRLAVIFCHARLIPNLRGIKLEKLNNLIQLTLPKYWSEKFPQSYYLLDEETFSWQKTNWKFEVILAS